MWAECLQNASEPETNPAQELLKRSYGGGYQELVEADALSL